MSALHWLQVKALAVSSLLFNFTQPVHFGQTAVVPSISRILWAPCGMVSGGASGRSFPQNRQTFASTLTSSAQKGHFLSGVVTTFVASVVSFIEPNPKSKIPEIREIPAPIK